MDVGEYKKMFELEDSHFWFVGKRMLVESIFKKHMRNSGLKILDVGCGTGGMTKWLGKYGEVVGQEKSSQAILYAEKRGVKVVRGDALKLKFADESFDLVTIFDVLYHKNISDDVGVLVEIYRVIKPGGFLMITDSAVPWLFGDHDKVMQARERYSLDGLAEKVEGVGFEILKRSYLFFLLFPMVVVKRFIKHKKKESDVVELGGFLNRLLILLMKIEALGLKYVSYPFGSSVGILARREERKG